MMNFRYAVQSDQLEAQHLDGHWIGMRNPTVDERNNILMGADSKA
jgi:hypothetical protein